MTAEWYEMFSLLMRYVFVILGLMIVWRVFRWIRRDAKQYNRDMRRLPDAGLVGEVVDIESGKAYPLPREGMMGSARGCDVCIRRKDVAGRHAAFIFEEGKGLRVTPYHRHPLSMDNTELTGAAHALHGSTLALGRCMLRVRLFAGLNVPHPSAFMRDGGMYEEAAPAYQTPVPYEAYQAPENREYQTPLPSQEQPYPGDDRRDMQMTWPYAVPPPQAQGSQPYRQPIQQNVPDSTIYPDVQNIPGSYETSLVSYSPYPIPPIQDTQDDDDAPAYQSPMPERKRRRDRR